MQFLFWSFVKRQRLTCYTKVTFKVQSEFVNISLGVKNFHEVSNNR
jgi:hypothetical protein